jgi:hypothetical protein
MAIPLNDIKKIANVLHTLYCGRQHELQMELFADTTGCKYYLEESIDRTWELDEHREWLKQTQCLISLSHPLNVIEVLRDIVKVYQIAEKLKGVNPKLLSYVLMLIK